MIIVYYFGKRHEFKNLKEWDNFDTEQEWCSQRWEWVKKLHRMDGPALFDTEGVYSTTWAINGTTYEEKEYNIKTRQYKLDKMLEKEKKDLP